MIPMFEEYFCGPCPPCNPCVPCPPPCCVPVCGPHTYERHIHAKPPVRAGFTAVKRDAVTSAPLSGAAFTLYQNGQQAASAVSQADGGLTFSDLAPGEYELAETSVPEGYQPDGARRKIVVDEYGSVTIDGEPADEFILPNTPFSDFAFFKTDADTGEALEGAVFTLSNGAAATSDGAGRVNFGRLTAGTYTMTETTPPQGYEPNPETFTVAVDAGGDITVNGTPIDSFTAANRLIRSPRPVINAVTEGDGFITGTGEPVAEIVVTLPDGTRITTTSNSDGIWVVPVPDGITLFAGQTVAAQQTVSGSAPSYPATFLVQPR